MRKYIESKLREHYPESRGITETIISEIVAGLEKMDKGTLDFDEALVLFRENDKKWMWPPKFRQLRQYIPGSTIKAIKKKVIMGFPNWHPMYLAALDLYRKADIIGYCRLGIVLCEELRGYAEAADLGDKAWSMVEWNQRLDHAREDRRITRKKRARWLWIPRNRKAVIQARRHSRRMYARIIARHQPTPETKSHEN